MAIDAIARNKAEALIREQLVNTIQQDVPKSSTVMQLGTRLANMTSNQTKIPVLSMLPLAYWVNGDTGMKKTSKQEWDNVYMTAAELAVIVPVPEAVLADSSFDIMGEVQPRVREAMGAKIDNAILFGGERPTEWTTDVLTLAAKNKVTGPIDYAKLRGRRSDRKGRTARPCGYHGPSSVPFRYAGCNHLRAGRCPDVLPGERRL